MLSVGGNPDGGRLWTTLTQHSDAARLATTQLSTLSTSHSGELPALLSVLVRLPVLSVGGGPDSGSLWSTARQHCNPAPVATAQLSAPSTSHSSELPPLAKPLDCTL